MEATKLAYEFERDEWRAAIAAQSVDDLDRLADQYRRAIGITGDRTDAADTKPTDGPDEAA